MKVIQILYKNHTRFTRDVNTFLSACNFNTAKLNKTKGKITALHRIRRENRYMYGPITKRKGHTSQESANNSQSNNAVMDSELWWNLKHSKCMMKLYTVAKSLPNKHVKKIQVYEKIDVSDQSPKYNLAKVIVSTKESNTINSVKSKDIKEVETTHTKQDTENKHNDASETIDSTDKLKVMTLENPKVLDVVLNNMTSFPILNPEKKLLQIAGKMDILSLSAKDEPNTLHYPSVTKILAATLSAESQRALELWKTKLIAEMGEDKFNEYYQEQLKSGALFHSCIENTLYGKSTDVPDNIKPAIDSLINVVKELEDIKAIESHVSHNHLQYKGKMDCIAVHKGELCVIDWKKSEKDKASLALTYDAPVQIAAYIGALNYSKIYPFTVKSGLIVVGYTSGKPADTYVVKDNVLKLYWKKWLMKLQQYWTSISKKN